MATDLGDVVRLTWYDYMPDGATLANATTVTLTVTLPDGTSVSPTVTNPPSVTGVYVYDYLTSQAGRHTYRFTATGGNPGAQAGSFNVLPVDPGYIVPLSDVRDQLNIAQSTTLYDEQLRKYVGSATAVVEAATGRVGALRSFTETRNANYRGEIMLSKYPAVAITSATQVNGPSTPANSWTPSQLVLEPEGRVYAAAGNTSLSGLVQVTYTAGTTVIPDNWIQAALIIVEHLWHTQRGTRGASRPGLGDDDVSTIQGFSFAVPRKALELLGAPLPGVA